MAPKPGLVIWGASGHALVVADVVRLAEHSEIVGFLDDLSPERRGYACGGATVLSGREELEGLHRCGVRHVIVGVGDSHARVRLAAFARERGLELAAAIHPRATVAGDVRIGPGTLIVAAAVINPGAVLGENVIISNSASFEHECVIEGRAHIRPGAHLAGRVTVGRGSWLEICGCRGDCGRPGRCRCLRPHDQGQTEGRACMTRKNSIGELAIFGGAPSFGETLRVGRPNIGDRCRLLARINDLLDRRWLTNNGPFVQKFERAIATLTGVRHCVAKCNATVAFEIVIRTAGLKGEVIVPFPHVRCNGSRAAVARDHAGLLQHRPLHPQHRERLQWRDRDRRIAPAGRRSLLGLARLKHELAEQRARVGRRDFGLAHGFGSRRNNSAWLPLRVNWRRPRHLPNIHERMPDPTDPPPILGREGTSGVDWAARAAKSQTVR